MNVNIDRQLIAQFAIVLSVVFGGWMMFVEPALRDVNRLEAEIEQIENERNATLMQAPIDEVLVRLAALRQRTGRIVERNTVGADTTRLYSIVRELAQEHGVTLRRLQPGRGRTDGSRRITVNQLEMQFDGTIDQVAAFVDALESIEGFVRPESLTLTPATQGQERVGARYACDVMYFPLEDVLLLAEGGGDES